MSGAHKHTTHALLVGQGRRFCDGRDISQRSYLGLAMINLWWVCANGPQLVCWLVWWECWQDSNPSLFDATHEPCPGGRVATHVVVAGVRGLCMATPYRLSAGECCKWLT